MDGESAKGPKKGCRSRVGEGVSGGREGGGVEKIMYYY